MTTLQRPAIAADDLRPIISAYNQVTERLKESHDRLMAEVSRLRGELADRNRQLERRKRLAALGEMAAGVAHEIRNPLGSIQLYADLLVRQLPADQKPGELAGRIASAVGGLDAIVNDMLTFTRIIEVERSATRFAGLLADAAAEIAPRLERAGVALDAAGVSADLTAELDSRLFKRVLINLMLNAADAMAKTDPARRVISVTAAAEPDSAGWRIVVADRGAGLDPKSAEKIFNPFFTTKSSGTGLGLAIVHHIVEAHGGAISAANRPDGGAAFTILLPQTMRPGD